MNGTSVFLGGDVMALTVNSETIADERVQAEMDRLRPEYVAYVRDNGGEPSEEQLREWAEEDLIEAAVFRQAAVASQPVPSDERVAQHLNDNAEMYQDVPEAERTVKAREAMQQRRLMKEIRKQVPRPDESMIRAYYDAHPELFQVPETLRLSHICRYASPVNKADVFLELLNVKTDLAAFRMNWMEALETFSESYGQDQGLFMPVSRETAPKSLSEALFALEPGMVSDVVEMPDGHSLHLFRLLAKEPPRTLTFEEVQAQLADVLFEDAFQDALHAKFDTLKAEAVIQRA